MGIEEWSNGGAAGGPLAADAEAASTLSYPTKAGQLFAYAQVQARTHTQTRTCYPLSLSFSHTSQVLTVMSYHAFARCIHIHAHK